MTTMFKSRPRTDLARQRLTRMWVNMRELGRFL